MKYFSVFGLNKSIKLMPNDLKLSCKNEYVSKTLLISESDNQSTDNLGPNGISRFSYYFTMST